MRACSDCFGTNVWVASWTPLNGQRAEYVEGTYECRSCKRSCGIVELPPEPDGGSTFCITIAPDADGGPAHFLDLPDDFYVVLKSSGVPVAEGIVKVTPHGEYFRLADAEGVERPELWGAFDARFDEIEYQ